jgi:hypothetical protein
MGGGGSIIEKIEANVEKSMPASKEEAFDVVDEALKFSGPGPKLADRFQSGGSGGVGPSAGKPMPK